MDSWDPLDVQGSATTEILAAAKKREIRNILRSYVGFFDPFCELIQNALDAVDLREVLLNEPAYKKKIIVRIDIKDNTLTVIDNGIGFSEAQFKTFLTPSISFKTSNKSRGNKGVGATYLAYGFNHLEIETRTPDFCISTSVLGGREWVDDSTASVPRPVVKVVNGPSTGLEGVERGSRFLLKFVGNVRPKKLNWMQATTAEQWKFLLLLKTPLGQLARPEVSVNTTFDLYVSDMAGLETSVTDEPCRYVYPHAVIKAAARLGDILQEQSNLIKQQKDPAKLPAKFKNLNGVYEFWNDNELAELLTDQADKDDVKNYHIWAYGFFCYSAVKVFDKFSDEIAKLKKVRIIKGGLQLATNMMPQGELITIPLTQSIGYQNQSHIIVHLSDAEPDLGRKGFQPELQRLSERIAVAMVGKLKSWRHLLLKDGGPGPLHQEDLAIDEWMSSQKEFEKTNPIRIANKNFFLPMAEVAMSSEPQSEQDVVSLFNQLIAGGVIRGIKIMSASSHKQYDGLFRFHLSLPDSNHLYDSVKNPLGLDEIQNSGFISKPYILEFKYDFDQLIVDFENEEKNESSVNLAVVWALGSRYKERYQVLSLLIPDNRHLRQFHGITHQLLDEHTGQLRMHAIVLSDLISFLNDPDTEATKQAAQFTN